MRTSDTHQQSHTPTRSNQPFFGTKAEQTFFSKERYSKPFFNPSSQSLAIPIQAKLTMGAVGDQYEQEADRVASEVVDRINNPSVQQGGDAQSVQRMGQEEDEVQMKPTGQRVGAAGGSVSADLETEINAARGGGQQLAPQLQAQMGQAMGADFSGVRVHTDTHADQLNRSVGARAFTTGQDLFFKQGEYQPGSQRGQELIAQELTSVKQQKSDLVQRVAITDSILSIRQTAFGTDYFTKTRYAALYGADTNQEVTDLWNSASIKQQNLNTKQKLVTPNPIYTFDLDKEPPRNARGYYGYNNPKKDSPVGLEILSKGLNHSTPVHTATDEKDADWHKNNARYESKRPGSTHTDFGYSSAILGHDEGTGIQGASDHFNNLGHTQNKSANETWNQDPNNYWGPEHQAESAASGASSPAYRIPLRESGSDNSWL